MSKNNYLSRRTDLKSLGAVGAVLCFWQFHAIP